MSNHNVIFEEETYQKQPRGNKTPESKIVTYIIKWSGGFIKNSTQANILLLVFVVLSLILTLTTVVGQIGPQEYPENIQVIPAV